MATVQNGVLFNVNKNDVIRLNNGEPWESVFGPGITKIGERAFNNCENLIRLPGFPEDLTEIGENAFSGCTRLTNISSFPKNLKKFGIGAFGGCISLTKLPDFPEGLKEIGNIAFSGCSKLTSIPAFPEGLTRIGVAAFSRCCSLTNIPPFPKSLTIIEGSTFYKCTGLKEIIIPETIIQIKDTCFDSCSSLRKVVFKNRESVDEKWLTTIGLGGYKQTKVGNDLIIGAEIEKNQHSETRSTVINTVSDDDIKRLNNGESWEDVFGANITEIGDNAFMDRVDLTKLPPFPKTLTVIGNYAFYGCEGLTELPAFPEGLTAIGNKAFADCTGLIKLPDFPKGMTEVGGGAFSNCASLTDIVFPGSVHVFGGDIFVGCSSLRRVVFKDTDEESNLLINIVGLWGYDKIKVGKDIIVGTEEGLKEYYEPEKAAKTKGIENGVLTSVDDEDIERLNNGESWESVFGPGITEIGESAFEDRTDLKVLPAFPKGLIKIGENAFNGCDGLTKLPDFPNGLKKIDDLAFGGCSGLEELPDFPSSLSYIGLFAFTDCTKLKKLPAINGLLNISGWAFSDCTGLVDITIPLNVLDINMCAFSGCSSLRKVVFKDYQANIKQETLNAIGLGGLKQIIAGEDLIVGTEDELKKYRGYQESSNININEIKEKITSWAKTAVASIFAAKDNKAQEKVKPEGKDSPTSKNKGKGK